MHDRRTMVMAIVVALLVVGVLWMCGPVPTGAMGGDGVHGYSLSVVAATTRADPPATPDLPSAQTDIERGPAPVERDILRDTAPEPIAQPVQSATARGTSEHATGDLTGDQWGAIRDAFPAGEEWTASRIMLCESGGDATEVGAAGERGLMQIHPIHRPLIADLGYTWDQMFDADANMEVARALYDQSGWSPWSCLSKVGDREVER